MNELIETIFNNFTVNGKTIPVSFLRYNGHGEPYVTYMETDEGNSLSSNDELTNYVSYYDFDIYSKGNYLDIVSGIKQIMKNNGFMFQPSRTSEDMYEDDTGYYHKTLCFAIERSEE